MIKAKHVAFVILAVLIIGILCLKVLVVALTMLIAPTSATAQDWAQAKVSGGKINNGEVAYWTLVKMRPILEADTNTQSFHVRASNKRGPNNEIITTIWSNKIGNTLDVDWAKGTIQKQPRNEAEGTHFSEDHPDQSTMTGGIIGFTHLPPEWKEPALAISFHTKDFKIIGSVIPFDHTPYLTLAAFVPTSYPIGAVPELAKVKDKPCYILLVDTDRKQIVGEIPLPADISGRPTFILDKENDVLLATQFELAWLIAIDLRPYLSACVRRNNVNVGKIQ